VFRVVAYAAAGTHYAFLAFGILGGFLAWRWPRLIWWQLAGAAWLVLVVAASLVCPLTWIEDRARARAGMAPKPGGFLHNYVEGVFYPAGHERAAMIVAAAVVLISWLGFIRIRAVRRTDGRASRRYGEDHGGPHSSGEPAPQRVHDARRRGGTCPQSPGP
jgi:hypothetical protein